MEDNMKKRLQDDMEFIKKFESFVLNFQSKLDKKNEELSLTKEMLLQNSKMALMGEMLDSVAHQWKQPLGVISLKSLYMDYSLNNKDLDKELFINSIGDIKRQVEHLVDTLDEFRSFFRPNYNVKKLVLGEVLNSITILLKDELIKHSIKLDIKSSEQINLYANENDIKHLFINLINNAKDEMVSSELIKEKRVIIIESKKSENDKIEIYVKDKGKGIKEDYLKEIFKPHFTTKKDIDGTGMGLYMCRMIVKKYNGEICAYNDEGAVFKIEFPNIDTYYQY